MSKLLIVESSVIVSAVFQELLKDVHDFNYDIVATYAEAKKLLSKKRYEYGVVERVLKDAPNGEIIALFNKHYLAPLVFTTHIDEEFFDDFEGAQIVDYIQKIKYNNEANVIKKLQQLRLNKSQTTLVVSDSKIYSSYLKQNLNLHSFKVFTAHNDDESFQKLDLHPEISLLIIDAKGPYVDPMEIIQYVKGREALSRVKILVLSEESNSYYTSTLLDNGADDYLIKEFSRQEFYVRVYQNINKVC